MQARETKADGIPGKEERILAKTRRHRTAESPLGTSGRSEWLEG